jgi:hypothetical protein
MGRDMRYVVVIAGLMFFFIWDGMYNEGRYLDRTVRLVAGVVNSVAM